MSTSYKNKTIRRIRIRKKAAIETIMSNHKVQDVKGPKHQRTHHDLTLINATKQNMWRSLVWTRNILTYMSYKAGVDSMFYALCREGKADKELERET